MELQNIKVTVDFGDGTLWIYENICSVSASDFLLNENDPNSKIFKFAIDSSNVKIETKSKNDTDKILDKLDYIISKTCDQKSCCKKNKNN